MLFDYRITIWLSAKNIKVIINHHTSTIRPRLSHFSKEHGLFITYIKQFTRTSIFNIGNVSTNYHSFSIFVSLMLNLMIPPFFLHFTDFLNLMLFKIIRINILRKLKSATMIYKISTCYVEEMLMNETCWVN